MSNDATNINVEDDVMERERTPKSPQSKAIASYFTPWGSSPILPFRVEVGSKSLWMLLMTSSNQLQIHISTLFQMDYAFVIYWSSSAWNLPCYLESCVVCSCVWA